ncbi:hypothetical protein GCM10010176_102730 [Nonomuraea spiralis]|nr:hypothetical protein GCM10010176_102730 [Nonomuraea spiralis]
MFGHEKHAVLRHHMRRGEPGESNGDRQFRSFGGKEIRPPAWGAESTVVQINSCLRRRKGEAQDGAGTAPCDSFDIREFLDGDVHRGDPGVFHVRPFDNQSQPTQKTELIDDGAVSTSWLRSSIVSSGAVPMEWSMVSSFR